MKGGHLEGPEARDWLYDGNQWWTFTAPRIETRNTHGTGCTFSAAIAAHLARGMPVMEAIQAAKNYLTGAIQHALPLGRGHGPLNHQWSAAEE
jgi:hydroxymethylpyrimidine/phosphomethylpyrimidine kinase